MEDFSSKPEKPIRIAQIIGDMNNSGVDNFVYNYYQAVDRTKIQFDFLVYKGSSSARFKQIEKMGGRIFYLPSIKRIVSYRSCLKKIFLENHYAIVHSHINALSVFPLQVAKQCGVPVRIAHSHSTANRKELLRSTIKFLLKPFSRVYATDFFACTRYSGEWLFGKAAVKNGKVKIVPDAVDTGRFLYSESIRFKIRHDLDIPASSFVIGNVGRLVKQKNQSFLVDAFSIFHKEIQDSFLLIVGDGPLHNSLIKKIHSIGLDKFVIFTGSVSNPEAFYSAMDLFAFPSIYEGFGMAILEAQINGLPCIVSSLVPNDALVSQNVEKINISKVYSYKWSERFIAFAHCSHLRGGNPCTIANGPYNLRNAARSLEDSYLSLSSGLSRKGI